MAVSTLLTVTYDGEPYLIVQAETPDRALELAAQHMGLSRNGVAAFAPEQRLKLNIRAPTPAEADRWDLVADRSKRNGTAAPNALPLSLLEDRE
jgi:hypothetical protein